MKSSYVKDKFKVSLSRYLLQTECLWPPPQIYVEMLNSKVMVIWRCDLWEVIT